MAGNISVLLFAFKIKVIECTYFGFCFFLILGNTNTDHFEEIQFFLQQKYMQLHFQYHKDYTFSGYFKVIHGFKNDFFLLFMAKNLKKSFGQGNSVITADVE